MPNFVSSIFPEKGGELYMEKDRQYFEEHPRAECYHRGRFIGEPHSCPFPVPYMVVFNFGDGLRMRIPYQKSSLSAADLEKLKEDYKQPLTKFKKMAKKGCSSNFVTRAKNKGFAKKK